MKWGILVEKTRDFFLNVGFSKGKRVIFYSMADFRRENACFPLKRGICKLKTGDVWVKGGILEEKTRDFCLNGGLEKTHDFRVKWGILEEKMLGFLV